MFSRALVKSFAVNHRLRLTVLGNLRPFALFDKLISSSLLCPGLFPDSSWAEASDLLRQSMDSLALRAWDGKVPTFNPPPSSRPRPCRAALPPPRASRSSPRPWRSDGSAGRSSRPSDHTSTAGDAPGLGHVIPVLLGHQKIYSIFVFGVLLILGVCLSYLPLASFGLLVS